MDIIKKIREIARDQLEKGATSSVFRISDCEIKELAQVLPKLTNIKGPIYVPVNDCDVTLLSLFLLENPLTLFGVDIIPDIPIYKRCKGYE